MALFLGSEASEYEAVFSPSSSEGLSGALHELQNADQAEIASHRCRLELARKQTSSFLSNLEAFGQDLAGMRAITEEHRSETVAMNEKVLDLESRLALCEDQNSLLNEQLAKVRYTQAADSTLMKDLQEMIHECQSDLHDERIARRADIEDLKIKYSHAISCSPQVADATTSNFQNEPQHEMQEISLECRRLWDAIGNINNQFDMFFGTPQSIESMQKKIADFQSALSRETEERKLESKSVWEAIDNHTHDVAPASVAPGKGAAREAADQTKPIQPYKYAWPGVGSITVAPLPRTGIQVAASKTCQTAESPRGSICPRSPIRSSQPSLHNPPPAHVHTPQLARTPPRSPRSPRQFPGTRHGSPPQSSPLHSPPRSPRSPPPPAISSAAHDSSIFGSPRILSGVGTVAANPVRSQTSANAHGGSSMRRLNRL